MAHLQCPIRQQKLFTDSCPDPDNFYRCTYRQSRKPTQAGFLQFMKYQIEVNKPTSHAQFSLLPSAAKAVSGYSYPFSLHIPWGFQVPPFPWHKPWDLGRQPAPCSPPHTSDAGAAPLGGGELRRPFHCLFFPCLQGNTTSLALGDLQTDIFS